MRRTTASSCVGVIAALALMATGAVAAGHGVSGDKATTPQGPVVFSPLAYGISCYMTRNWVYCWTGSRLPPTHHAKLNRDGQFSVTATVPIPLGLGGRDTAYGAHLDFGRFRCQSLRSGMKCTVIATGKGFRINRHETVRVG
jgi:hypothetical protein